jgi:hypothetical protein
LIIGLSVTGALAIIAIGVTFFLIRKEKKRTPVFQFGIPISIVVFGFNFHFSYFPSFP